MCSINIATQKELPYMQKIKNGLFSIVPKMRVYCKRGNIRWAKPSHRFHSMKFSRENFSSALCLNNVIIQTKLIHINNIHKKTFVVLLKTSKTQKFSPANLSTFTVLYQLEFNKTHCRYNNNAYHLNIV